MATLEGVAVRVVPMRRDDDFAFDAERIAAAVGERTRAIVLCSPCNPTARVVDAAAAERLVRALEGRAGEPVWIVHDEIYREQTFVPNPGYFARIYPHTIVTNSLSKSNALTGLRLGWIVGPADFVAQAIKVHAWATSCADTFAQQVALHVFHTPGALQEHAAWYRGRRGELLTVLRASGLRFIAPEGTFYACAELPDGAPSRRAAEELIEDHDVVAIPGIAFGQSMEGWLRLSWVGIHGARARRHPPHRRILRLRVTLQTFFTSMREAAAHADDVESFSPRLCRCAREMSRRRRRRQRAVAAAG